MDTSEGDAGDQEPRQDRERASPRGVRAPLVQGTGNGARAAPEKEAAQMITSSSEEEKNVHDGQPSVPPVAVPPVAKLAYNECKWCWEKKETKKFPQRSLACQVCKATWDKTYRSLAANYEVKTALQWLRLESTRLQRTVLSHFKLFASGGGRACDFHLPLECRYTYR